MYYWIGGKAWVFGYSGGFLTSAANDNLGSYHEKTIGSRQGPLLGQWLPGPLS